MGNPDSIDTKEACILFEAGALKAATAAPHPLSSGCYVLMFEAKNRPNPYTLAAQRDPIRIFKSSDAVIATANKIGFRSINFKF
ncbi:MAG: hypothetical protein LPH21_15865 [Shewanella sp.]|nr:hypothetical protein [Shewanella sp.]